MEEEAKDLSSTRSIWDWIKFNIRRSSIAFSKKLKKDRKNRELNSEYQLALKHFQENPNDVTRLQAENLKNELEALYDEKVEGIIIRARVRWHEHGEKNSRYFLNLEKRNNIKKHIRKLYISGSISANPFEIMNAQKRFYSKLYSRKPVDLYNEETKTFLESLNNQRPGPQPEKSYD